MLTYRQYYATQGDSGGVTQAAVDAFLRKRGFTELSDSALRRRNGTDAVEAALRMASACGAEREYAAIESLLKFAATDGGGRSTSHIVKACAYSLWAHVCLRAYELYDPNTESARERLEMRSWLFSAGMCANHASDLRLVSLAVIEVAQTISQSSECEEAFTKFTHLKRVYDEYKACKDRKDRPPTLSIPCAAGCGIGASKPSGLLRCTGQCPSELEPLYCTKECQKLDWKRHRLVCRLDATSDDVASLPPPNYSAERDFELRRVARAFVWLEPQEAASTGEVQWIATPVRGTKAIDQWKVEYSIDIKQESGVMERSYSTMSDPRRLKDVKYLSELLSSEASTQAQGFSDGDIRVAAGTSSDIDLPLTQSAPAALS